MINMVKQIVKRLWYEYKTWRFPIATKNILYAFFNREIKKCFGDKNEDITVYIIRSINDKSKFYTGPVHNLMANYFYVISHMKYAQLKGWIPVVDQLNYPVYNSMKEPINGAQNAWEYFWKQPSDVKLEDAYKSKNVVLSKRGWFGQWDMGYDIENYTNKKTIKQFYELAELVPMNEKTQQYCNRTKDSVFSGQDRVLGVSVRIAGHSETAFSQGAGHPRQPSSEEMIKIVKDRLQRWDMNKVFLATDSDYAVAKFREAFGQDLIVMTRMRSPIGYDQKDDMLKPMYDSRNIVQTTMDYIAEMELLSACNGLIGSISSGLRYAVVKNGSKYDEIEILDLGKFQDNRKRK